ncbi:hypothetical protein AVEN_163967-1 [Araneus ventricosus]|uniref:Uncharacterized protein n=1 Tax=Araneus ventricosus TaxID=182803 RepID=A0A4Y2LXF2_ARAVE|nr:hypothetical protein AVEN_263405-1 [Araneus ventricosus]GBN19139.1 hypothetical protein AVEN_163967-1 [Araneus ventricosus]
MNIIEDIRDALLHAVENISPPPRTPMDLWTVLKDEWCELPPRYLQTLVESMPHRVAALPCVPWHSYIEEDSVRLSSIRSGYCDEISWVYDIAVAAHLHVLAAVLPGLSVAQAQSADASLYKCWWPACGLSRCPLDRGHEHYEGQDGNEQQPHGCEIKAL